MAKSRYSSETESAETPTPEPVAETPPAEPAKPVAVPLGGNAPGRLPPSARGTSQDPNRPKPEEKKDEEPKPEGGK